MAKAEIASAYVSLIPTFKGGRKAIEDEFKEPAEDGGKESGERFGESFGGAFKSLLAAGAVFGGAALLANAFSLAIEQADLPGIMTAQFGLTEAAAADSAEIASSVYANGWGASLGEVGSAVGEVQRQLQQLGQTGDVEELTTDAQALADVFDQDVSSVINSASQLVKTGLVPDMASAFDVMATGFQKGLDTSGDLIDTITEYAVQFQNLGLDASTALGLINQGLEAGARNSDLIADAFKEFSIRATDGTAAEAFEAIGLSAEEMTAAITEGGPAASEALDRTLDTLRAIEDPAARDAAAFAIFGTQAEDLGDALYALDPSEAATKLGEVDGAAQDISNTVGGGLQAQIDTLTRSFNDDLAGALSILMPLFEGLLGILGPLLPILIPLAIAIGALVVVQWAWNAALAASPITWIILAIVALIAIIVLLVVHWDTVSAAIGVAWDWIVAKFEQGKALVSAIAQQIWSWITQKFEQGKAVVVAIVRTIVDYFGDRIAAAQAIFAQLGQLPGKVAEWFQGVYNAAKDKLTSLVDWVKGIPDRIMNALGDLKDLLFNAGAEILEGLLDGIESMWNSVQSKFSVLTDSIPDWKGPADRDKTLLYQSGRWIVGSLEDGIDDEIPAVESQLAALTNDIGLAVAPPRASLADPVAGGDWNATFLLELDGQALDAKITRVADDRDRQTRRRVLAGTGNL